MMKTKEVIKIEMRAGLAALTKRIERKHEPVCHPGRHIPACEKSPVWCLRVV